MASVSYSEPGARTGSRSIFGNRNPNGECCFDIPSFSNVLLSSDAKKAWYDAAVLTIDKPFTASVEVGRAS